MVASGTPDIDVDHHDPAFIADRLRRFDELRARCPVANNSHHGGYWLVTGYDEVAQVARDNDTFAHKYEPDAPDGIDYLGICGIPRPRGTPRQGVNEIDGPDHAELRRILNPFFMPKEVAAQEPMIAACSTWFLDQIVEAGAADLVLDYATPVPAVLTLQMMGLPSANWQYYADFFHASMAYDRRSPEYQEAMSRWPDMMAELIDFARHRRDTPGDDVTSRLVQCEIGGRPLTDDEVGGIMWNLVAGGLDTTTSLVSWALHHLGTHPHDRRRLADEPELVPTAVEEFLRYYSPSLTLTRTVANDTELGGRRLRAGDALLLSWEAANHDPAQFDRPDEIVIDRAENRHLAFGLGGHRCIGSHVARTEARIMIGDVLARIGDYVIDEERFRPYPPNAVMSGVVQMPVTFTPGPRTGPASPPF